MSYEAFLARKRQHAAAIGREIDRDDVHPLLYDWQRDSTVWAIGTGRCALFWDCGLGKTFAQVEWARLSAERSLIVAPLSVARQTVREARRSARQSPPAAIATARSRTTRPGSWRERRSRIPQRPRESALVSPSRSAASASSADPPCDTSPSPSAAAAMAAALGERAKGERYQHSQRQLRRGRAAMMDRPRPLEFDGNGFPVAQRSPSFVTRVARLLSP